jgi:hypothetical protein
MNAPPPTDPKPDPDEETESDRRAANIFMAVFAVVVVGLGIWLANSLANHRKLDDCLAAGRRNCVPIEAPPR